MESDVHPGVSGPSTHHASFLPCSVQGRLTWGAALEGDGCVEIASQGLPWASGGWDGGRREGGPPHVVWVVVGEVTFVSFDLSPYPRPFPFSCQKW